MEIRKLDNAYQCYKIAMQKRSARTTAMNDASSRSHALFLINVYRQQVGSRTPSPTGPRVLPVPLVPLVPTIHLVAMVPEVGLSLQLLVSHGPPLPEYP